MSKNKSTPLYPNITVELEGKNSNAFVIMGAVERALQRGLREKLSYDEVTKICNDYHEESMSGDYDNLIQTAMKYVNVI